MPDQGLKPSSRNLIAKASPEATVSACASLRSYLDADRWLGTRNRYRTDVVARLQKDLRSERALNQKHLAEYVAASVPLHTMDGWSFLGRALQADLMGDTVTARHLAYYAELRAAMGLLASQGIGVLNNRHIAVTDPKAVSVFGQRLGTHKFAWLALSEWARSRDSTEVVGMAVTPFGSSLSSWLAAAPALGTWEPRARNWLLEFGLDLKRTSRDQESRNEASYRPARVLARPPVPTADNARFALALWNALEPAGSGFRTISRHFLRLTLEAAHESLPHPAAGGADPLGWRIEQLLDGNNIEGPRRELLTQFLRRQAEPGDLLVIDNARGRSGPSDPNRHLEVMSRATLLLVMATGATRQLLHQAGLELADASFWWGLLGIDRGLWANAPEAEELVDLWGDITARDGGSAGLAQCRRPYDPAASVTTCPTPLTRLSHLELIGLWGIAA
ncbi:MAG: hypothetical protein U5K29_15915 [Acidimicrobiales bacterium]|nr:hypothetical protein [Acidimicrobiales bacterium]